MRRTEMYALANALSMARPYMLDRPCPSAVSSGPGEYTQWLTARDVYNNCVEEVANMLATKHLLFDRPTFLSKAKYCTALPS